jgi:hypothetical protein
MGEADMRLLVIGAGVNGSASSKSAGTAGKYLMPIACRLKTFCEEP